MTTPRKPRHRVIITQYGLWDELLASPSKPMAEAKRTHHLTSMWSGLAAIETAAEPSTHDWRVCSDAVNMVETFTLQRTWLGCDGQPVEITDSRGLLTDAIAALAKAGKRHWQGGHIRLDAAGIQAVRAILEDYAALIAQLPERQVIMCHRRTEQRIANILSGRARPHDVEIISV